MFEILAGFSVAGLPLMILAGVSIIVSVFISVKQRQAKLASDLDDPEDDPTVVNLRKWRKLSVWLGGIFLIVGAILLSAPAWATII